RLAVPRQASHAGEACRSRESVFQQARTSASSAAAGASKASGDCMAHRCKVPDHIAERLLGHEQRSIQGVYNRYDYFAEKSQALARLAHEIERTLGARSRKQHKR